MRKIIAAALSAMALAACGGNSVCDKAKSVSDRCGGTVNSASCETSIKNCNDNDKKIIGDLYDCLDKDDVCKNGKVVSDSAVLACFSAASGISSSCATGQ